MSCAICSESMDEGFTVITNCEHTFHRECLERWRDSCNERGQAPSCPMCRNKNLVYDKERPLRELRKIYFNQYNRISKLKRENSELAFTTEQLWIRLAQLEEENLRLRNANREPRENKCIAMVRGRQCRYKCKYGEYCGKHRQREPDVVAV